MEFQTQENKRKRTISLFTGYFLIAILIGLASTILVYLAQGYGYDTGSGVSQNGLIFVDSKPSPKEIFVDGIKRDKRITLAEGSHTINLKRDKYRDWNKSFSLDGGSVLYFLYPKLFPVEIPVGVTKVYTSAPSWVSQSPDRRWLILQQLANSPNMTIVDLSKPNDEPLAYTMPVEQLVVQGGNYGEFIPIEWSEDNQHLLLKQKAVNGSINFIVIDRQDSDKTVNVSKKLSIQNESNLVFRDKKYDKYYVHNSATGELKTADLKNGLAVEATLNGVVDFKSYADNLVLYTTYENSSADEAKVFVLNGESDKFLLQSIPRNPNNDYLLDLAEFDGSWYYTVASPVDGYIYLYRNPLKRSKPNNLVPIKSQMKLSLINPQHVSFSGNARFIAMQSGRRFVVFDGEQNRVYRYESALNIAPSQQAKWMDGHRFSLVTDGKVQVFEFDGTNHQTLINSRPEYGGFFDRDYKFIYTLITQADGKIGFENGQLILD